MVLLVLIVGTSYAVYQRETEVTFINSRVGEFVANDIELAMKLDGEEITSPPSKDNYKVEVNCEVNFNPRSYINRSNSNK